jgi:glycerophosphoryl diester phosphodiesterase
MAFRPDGLIEKRRSHLSRRTFVKIYFAWLAVLWLSAATFPAHAGEDFAVKRFKRVPFIMAHRACWGPDVPENSLRGIELCLKSRVDMIEVDIHRTRDGTLVLLHDDTLDRTTNLTGRVEEKSYSELATARLREGLGGADSQLSANPLPTLAEALRRIRGKAILFLDIKNPHDRQQILDLVTRERARDSVAMYAFFPDDRQAYERLPQWVQQHTIVHVQENGSSEDGESWQPSIAAAVHEYGDLHPLAFMVFLKNASFLTGKPAGDGIPLIAAPIYGLAGERDEGLDARTHADPDYLWGDLLKAGATAFMTNHPLEMLQYVQRTAQGCGPPSP